jgi:hypothetical protein
MSNILNDERAARLVEQHAIDPSLPGLEDVLDQVFASTFGAAPANAYEAEISRAVQRVVIDRLMDLAGTAAMPQVRAIATYRLSGRAAELARGSAASNSSARTAEADLAHAALLARDIERFLSRPGPIYAQAVTPQPPPGAPIGEPAMDWLRAMELPCSWWADSREDRP